MAHILKTKISLYFFMFILGGILELLIDWPLCWTPCKWRRHWRRATAAADWPGCCWASTRSSPSATPPAGPCSPCAAAPAAAAPRWPASAPTGCSARSSFGASRSALLTNSHRCAPHSANNQNAHPMFNTKVQFRHPPLHPICHLRNTQECCSLKTLS